MKKLLIILISLFLLSCEKDQLEMANLGENTGIVGTWVENVELSLQTPAEGVMQLKRAEDFNPDRYGFTFHADGSFTERKNSGWCATPPIAYDNFEGTWNPLNDTLIDITVAYWGGTLTYQMWIVTLEGDHLGIRYLFTEDRIDVK